MENASRQWNDDERRRRLCHRRRRRQNDRPQSCKYIVACAYIVFRRIQIIIIITADDQLTNAIDYFAALRMHSTCVFNIVCHDLWCARADKIFCFCFVFCLFNVLHCDDEYDGVAYVYIYLRCNKCDGRFNYSLQSNRNGCVYAWIIVFIVRLVDRFLIRHLWLFRFSNLSYILALSI